MPKEAEFTQIIKDHEGLIFKITSIYAGDKTDQQDLYQEIVYQLWKSFDSFRKESRISTWIYRVAVNTAITQNKKAKKRSKEGNLAHIVHRETKDPLFEERLQELYRHIKTLNKLEKGIILLFLEGLPYEEIAEITGLSTTNVGTRLSRIKKKLKDQMINKRV